jgi:hypothetical protein
LNEDIRWTTDLGNVFLSQESDVMSAVQRMRVRAQANGHLATTQQQTITTQEQDGQQAIVIQPADPEIIYVPVYDPSYIWGPPLYGYYPALYYPTFGFGFGIGYDLGFCFADWRGWGLWGWGPNWYGHTVFMNSYFFNHYGYYYPRWAGDSRGRAVWSHNPAHRLNVPYGNDRVASRFGGRSTGFRESNRAGGGPRSAGLPYTSRSEGRFAGSNLGQGYRSGPSQTQRYQNAPRQRYQSSQQYREGSRVMSFGSQRQERFQAQQQFRSAPQMSAPRFGGGSFSRGGGFNGGGGFNRSGGSGGGGGRHR